jgi:hypothetical protein
MNVQAAHKEVGSYSAAAKKCITMSEAKRSVSGRPGSRIQSEGQRG